MSVASENGWSAVELPASWRLQWIGGADPVPAGALALTLSAVEGVAASVSMAVMRRAGPFAASPSRDQGDLALPEFPTLDETWALYLWAALAAGRSLPPALEAVAQYAEDVRQGHWPDHVPPEQSVQALFQVIAQQHLLVRPPDRRAFLREALRLCDLVARRLVGGARLLDDPLARDEPWAQHYASMLAADQALYQEDVGRGRRFMATLPAEESLTGTERRLPLLALRRPVAAQFKLWARRDAQAPGGHGYPLLAVELAQGNVVFSADPASKVRLGWLAAPLSAAEEKARGAAAAWYDGRRHGFTLSAAPKEGTRLSFDEVLQAVAPRLRLKAVKGAGQRHLPRVVSGVSLAAGIAVLVGAAFAWPLLHSRSVNVPAIDVDPPAARGAKGEPVPKAAVLNLLGDVEQGPRSFAHYALVAGACAYSGDRALKLPCRDAHAVRELLVQKYGYAPENVLFYVDQAEPGERVDGAPTAANLRLGVERFRERFGEHDPASFLFYYSGHGGYEKGARKDFGVLQPTGYFDHPELPISDRGWDMQELLDAIHKGIPARHVMVVLDACYSGWAVGAKGDEVLRPELMSLWKERAEVVVSAGTKGQRAWEDEEDQRAWAWGGHSAFTAFLLQGLTPTTGAPPPADRNADGVVTDEELAKYLRTRVPEAVRALKRAEQVPQFFRFDDQLPQSGQFLFVPVAATAQAAQP
ncbi:MAG: caspase family protein [Deltaproteobacteria bacterium]|nr:caspase family protein [Deltaproteobacteria bacterium]